MYDVVDMQWQCCMCMHVNKSREINNLLADSCRETYIGVSTTGDDDQFISRLALAQQEFAKKIHKTACL